MRSNFLSPISTLVGFWLLLGACLGSALPHGSGLVRRDVEPGTLLKDYWQIGSPRPTCRVGLYQHIFYFSRCHWEGIPLSNSELEEDIPAKDGVCRNFQDLNKCLGNNLLSMARAVLAQGYCRCEFYNANNCQGDQWTMQNSIFFTINASKRLPKSFRCFHDTGFSKFEKCSLGLSKDGTLLIEANSGGTPANGDEPALPNVRLIRTKDWNGGELPAYMNEKAIFEKNQMDPKTGQGDCRKYGKAEGGLPVRGWASQGYSGTSLQNYKNKK
ncbi:hypothetical protein TWF481_007555 [Arthrobotrys musiformis]|uniref:Uncharacterized protein n=1 Tax=Arthrobotrys musiformis TaxID=47236 RepID=A0AAV9WE44_9PEZI